jgi:glutathione S-transferase
VQFVPAFFKLLLAKTDSEREHGQEEFTRQLHAFNDALKASSSEGPFFFGSNLGAVDISLIPFAVRLFLLEKMQGYKSEETSCSEKSSSLISKESVCKLSVRQFKVFERVLSEGSAV